MRVQNYNETTVLRDRTHVYTHVLLPIIDNNRLISPVLFWAAGREAAIQVVKHWSVTLQPADLTLKRCLRVQPGHKSFISLRLITSLCQWSSVTTHLQVMILRSAYRSSSSQTACTIFTHHDYPVCYDCWENPARDRKLSNSQACTCDFEQMVSLCP